MTSQRLYNPNESIPQQVDELMLFFSFFGVVLICFIDFFLALRMYSCIFLVFSPLHQFPPQNSFSMFPAFLSN
jgi:hypothetical protein